MPSSSRITWPAAAAAPLILAAALAGCVGPAGARGEVSVLIQVTGTPDGIQEMHVTLVRVDAVKGMAGRHSCPTTTGVADATGRASPTSETPQGPDTGATIANPNATTSDGTQGPCPPLEPGKLGVCHMTGSSPDRHVYIVVDQSGWVHGHRAHDGDFLANSAADCADDAVQCSSPPGDGPETTPTTNTSVPAPTATTTAAANQTTTPTTSPTAATYQGPTTIAPNATPNATTARPPSISCSAVEPRDDADTILEGRTVDLMGFKDAGPTLLGSKALVTGRYSELRLFVGSVLVVRADGERVDAVVPQGPVVAVKDFAVDGANETAITLTIDLAASIVPLEDGSFVARPTVTDVDVEVSARAAGAPDVDGSVASGSADDLAAGSAPEDETITNGPQ